MKLCKLRRKECFKGLSKTRWLETCLAGQTQSPTPPHTKNVKNEHNYFALGLDFLDLNVNYIAYWLWDTE